MNILVIGKFYTEGFALHIAETLAAMGHDVRRYEPGFHSGRIGGRVGHRFDQIYSMIHSATDSVPAVRSRRIRALWQAVEQGPLDMVIVCHDFLWPEEVTELKRRTGAAIAMWFPDAMVNLGKAYFMNAPYDALFFKDPYIIHMLSGILKSPVYYLPEAFNPARHCLPEGGAISSEYRCDITSAGNSHSWRAAVLNNLEGYDVKLWGQPAPLWMPDTPVRQMHQGRVVLNQDKARAFLGAKIVLNNLYYGEVWGVNARCFEAAGIGAFQMLDWRPGLAQLFEDGVELISFRGANDMRDKVDLWLARPAEERLAIASAGKKRAHSDHTYRLRLDLLIATLTGRSKGYPVPDLGMYRADS